MKRKYLVKTLTIKCPTCFGKGKCHDYSVNVNFNCNYDITCSLCKGTGLRAINSKNYFFKEEYPKFIKRKMEKLIIEYTNAQKTTKELGNELSKYCKEFDKIINKNAKM